MGSVRKAGWASEVFSYHLIEGPARWVLPRLLFSAALRRVGGLRHAECLLMMEMGESVLSMRRYNFGSLAFFGWWQDEEHLERFLAHPPYPIFDPDRAASWHVRMRFYRQWGRFAALEGAHLSENAKDPGGSVVAVTLARLRVSQTLRFAKWGKPVEAQVRDDPNQALATVAFRPLNTFSTFSVWNTERDMRNMVRGHAGKGEALEHRNAMVERNERPFHHEFITMRFAPISEHGAWRGRTNVCRLEHAGASLPGNGPEPQAVIDGDRAP